MSLIEISSPVRGIYIQIPGDTCVVCDEPVEPQSLCCGPLCYAKVREYQELIRQNIHVYFSSRHE